VPPNTPLQPCPQLRPLRLQPKESEPAAHHHPHCPAKRRRGKGGLKRVKPNPAPTNQASQTKPSTNQPCESRPCTSPSCALLGGSGGRTGGSCRTPWGKLTMWYAGASFSRPARTRCSSGTCRRGASGAHSGSAARGWVGHAGSRRSAAGLQQCIAEVLNRALTDRVLCSCFSLDWQKAFLVLRPKMHLPFP